MSAAIFDPLILPEGWMSTDAGVSPAAWFDQALADSTAFTATLSGTLAAVAVASTTQAEVHAALARTLDTVTVSSVALAEIRAFLAATLAPVGLSTAAQAEVHTALSATLASVVVSSTGTAEVHATVGAQLADTTLGAAGTVDIVGTLFATGAGVSSSSSAAVAVVAALGKTLDSATLDSGVVTSFTTPRFVDASILLDSTRVSSGGVVAVQAVVARTLDAVTLSSSIARHRSPFGGTTLKTSLTLKEGDLEPPLSVPLVDATGVAVDLTLAQSVAFRMALTLDRVEIFSRPALVDDAASGVVSYAWQTGDVVPGVYYGEFAVTWPGNRVETYPQTGYLVIAVEPKL